MTDEPIDAVRRDRPALDEVGRPQERTADGSATIYGEPKGPRPPHFEILPKEEIEDRARGGCPGPAADRPHPPERDRDGFESGMTTPETFETTAGQHPGIQRRDLDGRRLPEDGPGDGHDV